MAELEEVKRLAAQLTEAERQQLAAFLGEEIVAPTLLDNSQVPPGYFESMDAFIRLIDEGAVETEQELDSAETIRRIRDERTDKR